MHVQVPADAATGGCAEVDADVERVGLVGPLQGDDGVGHGRPQLGELVGTEILEVGDLPVRQHHHVSGGVREGVHDDEAGRATMDDVGLAVVESALEDACEHAALIGRGGCETVARLTAHVGGAPPVPQVVEDAAAHGARSVRARTAIEPGSLRRMSEPGSTITSV